MRNFPFGYREVIPDQTLPEKWKEFTLNMGGTQFTLQETKVPDSSGGYSYKDYSNRFTRNRFIYWRIQRNELELVEHSLELNLVGNCVRYKFQNTLLLEGLSVHEALDGRTKCVVVLVTTVSSVHRLSFPHPLSTYRQYTVLDHGETNAQSIFADASFAAASDTSTFHVINNALANVNIPHTSTSYLTDDGNALFALAYKTGLVMLIRMSESGDTSVQEMRESRGFLFGLADAFKSSKSEDVVPVSMVLHCMDNEVYLFSLCCGGSLRITPCYDKSKSIIVFNVNSHDNECHKCVDIRGVRRHVLRKAVGSTGNRLYLGAFLYGRSTSEFCVVRPVLHESGKMTVSLTSRRFHDPKDHILIDFCLTRSRLWTLWHTQDEVPVLMNSLLDGDAPQWEHVVLEPPPDRESVVVDPGEYPQQAYISYIFQPGLFPLNIIARALNVYQKSPVRGDALAASSRELEARVCRAMEETVQEKVSDQDLTEEEKLRVAHACWAQFCSSCVSFHGKAAKMVGLMVAQPADGIVLLKQSQFSLVRPMDALEHLLLMNLDTCMPEHFHGRPVLSDSPATCADLIKLMCVVQALEREAPEVHAYFRQELDNLKTPQQIVDDILINGLVGRIPQMVLHSLENLVASCDVVSAMRALVGALACDFGEPRREGSETDVADFYQNLPKMYSSHLGASTIAQSLHQMAVARLSICWSILLCQKLMLTNNRIGLGLDSSAVTTLTSVHRQTSKLTQLYNVLAWACGQTAVPSSLDEVVASLKNASLIKQLSSSPRRLTVVELFFQMSLAASYSEALSRLDCDEDKVFLWQCSMLTYITTLGGLLWPTSNAHAFLHFLMSAGQQTLLEEYDRLLEWLGVNDHVCKFLLGQCYLASGEETKALYMFEWAADGAGDEFFSRTLQLDPNNYSTNNQLLVAYYTKVISMFELRNHHECVIQLAVRGIANMPDNHGLATLKSVLFNQYLHLRLFRQAYEAMSTNPDPLQQDSHLRQLVLRLFDQERVDLLLEFSTQGVQEIQDKVESIVRHRAQTMSVRSNVFYKFLLVFYLEQGNTRKAASVMYEQGLRLGLETPGDLESLQTQSNCYLSCISLLRAEQPKYAWIVKPVLETDSPILGQRLEQRSEEAAMSPSPEPQGRVVEVLELKEIQREYELVSAHIQLIRYNPERSNKGGASTGLAVYAGNQKSVSELVAELTSKGLYRAALRLCQVCGTSPEPVVEGLTTVCVSLGSGDEAGTWEWLSRNDVADLRLAGHPAQDVAWKLLRRLLEQAEAPRASVLHKAVTRRLCLLAAFLPEWLQMSYKRHNPAELLRVLLDAGRLADAARLAEEYVWAVLGHGKEQFGLESALAAGGPQVYVPTHAIDLLLRELNDAGREDNVYRRLYNALQQLMAYYLETVMRVSRDKLRAAAAS